MNNQHEIFLGELRRVAAGTADEPALANMVASGSPVAGARRAGLGEARISQALAGILGIPWIDNLLSHPASAEFLDKVPIGFARRHGLIGLSVLGAATEAAEGKDPLSVAIASIDALPQLEVVARYLGRPVVPCVAPPEQIAAAINLAYQQKTGQAQALIENLDHQDILAEVEKLSTREDLLDVASRAPVIKLVNLMLFEAVKQEASDVHVQPYEDQLVVRMRIDGVLVDAYKLTKGLQDEIISRIKVLGRMNIAEKRLAQDGRATVQVGDRVVDLRIASLPTSFGERIVIRLLDKSARLYRLGELGMPPQVAEQFRQIINLDHGLVLVTGPTGGGKSTTLYAALQEMDAKELNILTLEDPIEYQLPGISQTQVSDKKGMTFASGLRNVLRQDPDIIMVGEIRDHETAAMAIQSALTGHMVFSTLHTNDAAGAVARLLDLNIEPYLVASSVVGVLAQRLVRRVCPNCEHPVTSSLEELHRLGLSDGATDLTSVRAGRGCANCRNTGYRGRLGIFELLVIDDPVRRKIQTLATAAEIKNAAIERGMRTLRDDGVTKVLSGTTTIEEVLRVTMRATV